MLASLLVSASGVASADVLTFAGAASLMTNGTPGLGQVGALAVSPDGRHLYATSARDSIVGPTLTVLRRDGDGTLTYVQTHSEGQAPTEAFCGAYRPLLSPDGRHLYVLASCSERIRIFRCDENDGRVTPIGELVHVDGRLDGLVEPRAVAISPDGRHLYVGLSSDGALGVLQRDATTGLLTWRAGALVPSVGVARIPRTYSMAISPDGTSLYVPDLDGSGDDDALHVFRREPTTGALTLVESLRDGTPPFVSLGNMTAVVVSPDGRHVYAGWTGYDPDAAMIAFRRDPATGRLTPIQAPTRSPTGSTGSLAVSPDGRLIVAGGDYALSVWRRDVGTGRVTLVEQREHQEGATDGLYLIGALMPGHGVAFSPDARDVYTAAGNEASIGQFRRVCPDGVLDDGETCDDGNDADGDGCNVLCRIEPCFACVGAPSTCMPLTGPSCDDDEACTTASTCVDGRCTAGTSVADDTPCDDGNACTTTDTCREGRCAGAEPPVCSACEACDPRWGCVGTPRIGCVHAPRVGRAGSLLVERTGDDGQLRFRWTGPKRAFPASDLGDPTTDTAWTLCVFDESGITPLTRRRRRAVAVLHVPAGGQCGTRPCWRRSGAGFRYRSPDGHADGVVAMRLATPAAARALTLVAGGTAFDPPLPLTLPVSAELRTSGGTCWAQGWEAYVRRNDTTRFVGPGGLEASCGGRDCR